MLITRDHPAAPFILVLNAGIPIGPLVEVDTTTMLGKKVDGSLVPVDTVMVKWDSVPKSMDLGTFAGIEQVEHSLQGSDKRTVVGQGPHSVEAVHP